MKKIDMAAVYIKVKLTNAIDEALVSRGMLAPHLLRECEIDALVDTGATYLVIPAKIIEELGLRIRGKQKAKFADGREETACVTEALLIECENRQTTEDALVIGDMVLIGQVILEKLDLLVDCKNQLIPNPVNPDYPVTLIL